jgi:hypothetical protein
MAHQEPATAGFLFLLAPVFPPLEVLLHRRSPFLARPPGYLIGILTTCSRPQGIVLASERSMLSLRS